MQNVVTDSGESYPFPLDAVVLAGTDDNPRRMIRGQNKAFLEVGGKPLVLRVTEALLGAGTVGQVFVVGPAERLEKVLHGVSPRVTVVEQAGKLLANGWQAIRASEARYRECHGHDDPLRPLLFISADLPLISPQAVDDFVTRCAAEEQHSENTYSLMVGVAEESSLRSYYPDENGEGIIRPYVHLKEYRIRLANIYVGRPRTLANQEFLQTGFEHRKAEKWKNVLYLAWKFLGQPGGPRATWITLRLQATLLASRGGGRIYRWLRERNTAEEIEEGSGRVLGGTVRIVVTPYGGLSLDVDNEHDFRVLSERFEDWKKIGAGSDPALNRA